MSSKATNPLIGNAEQSAVYRSTEGTNQGKASCIVLTVSSVRSAVYRSLLKRERGRKPHVASLFFYVPKGAANACNTTDSNNLKQTLADTYKEETAAPPTPHLPDFPDRPGAFRRNRSFPLMPQCVRE